MIKIRFIEKIKEIDQYLYNIFSFIFVPIYSEIAYRKFDTF
ncbi:hypothetical protein MPTP_0406 [Melissococcus plutonius ATCC 35311]|uniref:Uncharacterized protein n=1 Tax=Melissococcus plutonius (strain ATCC 35311 / DSM 29964 / CIP 104052 / LMG 20360 / NCIMB 702443) TaxID=940190 RepID=F3Y8R0_MELPT|nr:hypothetical protein MPTP_0406 [Melissococcus plutonius ATCC 35311]BAL62697.1 hypothetical protein MPD5_1494 [Melissococcus plutonius DAT561]